MKKGVLIPLILVGGAGAFMYLRNKKRAGESLKFEPVDIGIDSKRTRQSFFTKLFYTVKLNLINTEAANVNVRNIQLNASVNGKPLGSLTSKDSFVVPKRGNQIVALDASISTIGAGSIILNYIKNKTPLKVTIQGAIDTDLGRVNVNYTQDINLGISGPEKLKGVYTASQCTDVNDCNIALSEITRIARSKGWNEHLRRRAASISKKRTKLQANV